MNERSCVWNPAGSPCPTSPRSLGVSPPPVPTRPTWLTFSTFFGPFTSSCLLGIVPPSQPIAGQESVNSNHPQQSLPGSPATARVTSGAPRWRSTPAATQRGGAVAKPRLPWKASLSAGRGPRARAGPRVRRGLRSVAGSAWLRPVPSCFRRRCISAARSQSLSHARRAGSRGGAGRGDSGASTDLGTVPPPSLCHCGSAFPSLGTRRGKELCFINAINDAYQWDLLFQLRFMCLKESIPFYWALTVT